MSLEQIGIEFVAKNEREATEAVKRFDEAKKSLTRSVLDGASRIQSTSAAWDRANKLYREGTITAGALRAAQTQLARELAVLNGYVTTNNRVNTDKALAELRAAETSRDAARAAREQADATIRSQQSYDRLRASIDPAFAAQQRMAQAHRTIRQALQNENITRQQAADSLRLYRQRLREAGQTTVLTTTLTGRLRAQFLATANTIAILDGPLGGIASRFSAFGVLLGRTGILLAATAVGFTALGAAIAQSIRVGIAAETSMFSLEAAVKATGGAAGVTALQIENMSRAIEAQTLASREGVRQAATQLLTFETITGDMFERTLRISQDIAQVFGRDIVAVSLQVAKALDNPAQSLASIERAYGSLRPGIRATAIDLMEQGKQAEALSVIMGELERRFSGMGEDAAAGLAGQLDTLSASMTDFRETLFDIVNGSERVQATFSALNSIVVAFTNSLGTLTRIAQVAAVFFGARGVLAIGLRLYAGASALATAATFTLTGAFTALRAALVATGVGIPIVALGTLISLFDRNISSSNRLRRELDALRDASQANIGSTTQFTAEMSRLSRVTLDVAQANLEEARTRQAGLAARQAEMQAVVAAESEFTGLMRRRQSLMESLEDTSVQEAFLPGFTEELLADLARVEEEMESLLKDAVPSELREALAGVELTVDNLQTAIENARNGFVVLGDGSRAFTNDVRQSVDAFLERIDAQERELALLNEGLSVQQAREQMERDSLQLEIEALLAKADSLERSKDINLETLETIERLRDAADTAQTLADNLDDARNRSDMRTELDNTLEGMQEQLAVLDMQLDLLESGKDFILAQRLAEIELQKARIQTKIATEGITDELEQQLALLNAMADVTVEIADREARVATFRPARAGSSGGGRAERPSESFEDIVAQMNKRIEREQQLLQVRGQARAQLEAEFALRDALESAEVSYHEAALQRAAAEIAAGEAKLAQLQRQEAAAQQIENAFQNFFTSFVTGASTLRGALSNLLSQLAQMAANAAFQSLMGGMPSSGGFFATLASVLFNANGNAFSAGRVIPFANGGVVDSPTMFPMSGSSTGLMGEAGPEAIIPLSRGSDGRLGVRSEGGTQSVQVDVRVHMDEGGNWKANVEKIADKRVQRQTPGIVRRSVQATYASSAERRMN